MGRKCLENCPNLCLVGTVAKNKKKSRLTKKETDRGQIGGLTLCGIQKTRESPPPISTTAQLCHVFCPSTQNLGWSSTQPVEETTHPPTQLVIDEQKHFHCSRTYLCFGPWFLVYTNITYLKNCTCDGADIGWEDDLWKMLQTLYYKLQSNSSSTLVRGGSVN